MIKKVEDIIILLDETINNLLYLKTINKKDKNKLDEENTIEKVEEIKRQNTIR